MNVSDERQFLGPSMDHIIQVVNDAYGVIPSALLKVKKGRGKKNMPRKVAMYLAQKQGGYRLTEIADVFALKHCGSVSNAIFGVVKALKSDRNFEKSINAIINRLEPQFLTPNFPLVWDSEKLQSNRHSHAEP
jgi:chromosomal replication initiation ATPase DnaA